MEREVRYCTSEDGVRIAYSVEGDGPALLWMPLFIEPIAKASLTLSIVHFLGRLRQENRVVRYDQRGTGLSQREVEDFSTRAQAADIEAVLTAANAGPVVLMSFAAWSILTLSYAASHPKRVNGLVLWNGQATTEDTLPKGIYDVIVQMLRTNWAVGARTLADFGGRAYAGSQLKTPGTPWSIGPVDSEHLAEAWLLSATGETVAAIMEANRGADVTALLPQIRCPALILQNEGRSMDSAQRLASGIADSRLVPLATDDTAVNSDGLDTALGVITNFLAERAGRSRPRSSQPQSADHALRTVLFTDLVAHTEMMSRLGDERGRDVLREHERITRDVLKAHGGSEVKTVGDGFMASFGSVTKAMECAVALQKAFAKREGEPLSVRIGLNAGEPIEEDGDLFGATVILAARIAAKADGGEILVADTVRGLCSGKGFLFADRGEFGAKGFEDPVRVYEVSWRGAE